MTNVNLKSILDLPTAGSQLRWCAPVPNHKLAALQLPMHWTLHFTANDSPFNIALGWIALLQLQCSLHNIAPATFYWTSTQLHTCYQIFQNHKTSVQAMLIREQSTANASEENQRENPTQSEESLNPTQNQRKSEENPSQSEKKSKSHTKWGKSKSPTNWWKSKTEWGKSHTK